MQPARDQTTRPPLSAAPIHPGASQDLPLYSPRHIAIATFFGTVLAGGILLALNFKRMRKPELARRTIILSAIAVVALVGIATLLDDQFLKIYSKVVHVATIAVLLQVAQRFQGEAFREAVARHGRAEPWYKAVGIGLACFVLVVGTVVGASMVMIAASTVDIGKASVTLEGGATRQEAEAVVDALNVDGEPTDLAFTLRHDKDQLVVEIGADPSETDMSSLAQDLADLLTGKLKRPVRVRLLDLFGKLSFEATPGAAAGAEPEGI